MSNHINFIVIMRTAIKPYKSYQK